MHSLYLKAVRRQITPDVLAQLVRERARSYVKFTFDVMRTITTSGASESESPMVQMAWAFYFHATHRNPKGQMIELLTVLAPAMTDFFLAIEKFTMGTRS